VPSKEDPASQTFIFTLKSLLFPLQLPNPKVKSDQVIAMSYQLKDGVVNEDHYGTPP